MQLTLNELVDCLDYPINTKYLYNVYAKQIENIVEEEYGINCSRLVSSLITHLAFSNFDLSYVISKYYYNHFFGFNSSNYRKLRNFHIVTNALIITNYLIVSTQFYCIHFSLLFAFFSFLPPILPAFYYKNIANPDKLINNLCKLHQIAKFSENKNIKNIVSYYNDIYNMNSLAKTSDHGSIRTYVYNYSHLITVILNTRYIISLFISSHIPFIGFINTVSFVWISFVLAVNITGFTMPRYRKEPKPKRGQYTVTRLIMDDNNNNNIVILFFQFMINGLIYDRLKGYRSDKTELPFIALYCVGRIFAAICILNRLICNGTSSFSVHFGINEQCMNVVKILCIILHGAAYFAEIGHSTHSKDWQQKPRDIFEWTYYIASNVYNYALKICNREFKKE